MFKCAFGRQDEGGASMRLRRNDVSRTESSRRYLIRIYDLEKPRRRIELSRAAHSRAGFELAARKKVLPG